MKLILLHYFKFTILVRFILAQFHQPDISVLRRLIYKAVASLVISHFLIVMGRSDWLDYMASSFYPKDLLIGFLDALILFEVVDRLTVYLNKKLEWKSDFKKRLSAQLFLVVFLPSLLVIILTFSQDKYIYNQERVLSEYFVSEFLVSVLFILIVNLVFIAIYFFNNSDQSTDISEVILLGKKSGKVVPVESRDIAYLVLRNEVIYLGLFNGEEILMKDNLDAYEEQLSEEHFFRANRQMLINKKSCSSYKSVEHGKIVVELAGPKEQSVVVSQKRASRFRSWMKS